MLKYWSFFVLFLVSTSTSYLYAQDLPRGLSESEKRMIEAGDLPKHAILPGAITSRWPLESPRSIAEWEELQAIAITWSSYRPLLTEIVRNSVSEVVVIIINQDEAQVRSTLENAGIDPDFNIEYISAPYNSVWMRDYGPNPAYVNDVDSLILVDWIYNRPRPLDDVIPMFIAEHLGVDLLSTTETPTDLVNTGGNYMTDGLGRAFASNLVLTENGPNNLWGESNHSESSVDGIMEEFMGINEYVKMTILPYDGIHHIDMHMKIIDEQTLMVGEYPEGVADGPQIEANIQYVVEQFKTQTNTDYNVVRIPMPPDQFNRYPNQNGDYRTYVNSLFVNNTILVPTYEEKYDTTALRIWEETMPGYRIVGLDCNDIIRAGGAIHCITKEIGVDGPLWMTHFSPHDVSPDQPVEMQVKAKHRTGVESVTMYYRFDENAAYETLALENVGQDTWSVSLTDLLPESTLYYYFEGEANDGKKVTRPIPAPVARYTMAVGETSTSVNPISFEKKVKLDVYPNPANAITCIPITANQKLKCSVVVSDTYGREVLNIFNGEIEKGESKLFFDASKLTSGAYIIRLSANNQVISKRIIVL